jgi:hypothetical protein
LPVFAYNENPSPDIGRTIDQSVSSTPSRHSPAFHFSAFFDATQRSSPSSTILRSALRTSRSILRDQTSDYFIGFSWGPTQEAFRSLEEAPLTPFTQHLLTPSSVLSIHPTPRPLTLPSTPFSYPFATPLRRSLQTPHPGISTLPRTSSVRRTVHRRAVSDREAMRQLVDCIGMSAQKKVLAAGRTPRTLGRLVRESGTGKTIRFVPAPIEIGLNSMRHTVALGVDASEVSASADARGPWDHDQLCSSEDENASVPPSPSPSPRPGSAMSMLSRRSATPTTGTWSLHLPSGWGNALDKRSSSPTTTGPQAHRFPDHRISVGRDGLKGADCASASAMLNVDDVCCGAQNANQSSGFEDPPIVSRNGRRADDLGTLEDRYEDLIADIARLSHRIEHCT